MLTVREFKSASNLRLKPRSHLMRDIDKALQAYEDVARQRRDDLDLQIYALSLVIAAIERWYETKRGGSRRLTAALALYNQAKLERNRLKSRAANQRELEEQQRLIAAIAESKQALGQAIRQRNAPASLRTPARPAPPLTPQQKKETTETIATARKELLTKPLGQHLLSELTKRRIRMLGMNDDTSKLDQAERTALIEDLPGVQMGYVVANQVLKVDSLMTDRKEAARAAGLRILAEMLANNQAVAKAFFNEQFEVVVVPRDQYMTDVAQFSALGGQQTFDGRAWENVRGAGYVYDTADGSAPSGRLEEELYMKTKRKIFVAVTEENLIGADPAPGIDGGAGYTCGYSTTLHEFAHTIDKFALTSDQRDMIQRLYIAKRSDNAGNELTINNGVAYFGGDIAKAKEILERQWADGPRLKAAAGPEKDVWVSVPAGGAWNGSVRLNADPCDNYAASHRLEYFAQTVCAYYGANTGTEPYTQRPRNNGRDWVKDHEPKEFLDLLDELFGYGRHKLDKLNPNLARA